MKRIFIALKVEANVTLLKMVSTFKTGLNKEIIRWTDTGNTHITLAFLGDTGENIIYEVSSMLHERCKESGKFELTIKGCGVFRNVNDPRILWIGIEQSRQLDRLNGIIMDGLKDLKIKMEDRPFKPHLTIGRIKHINDKESLKYLIGQFQNIEIQIVPVNEVILYESILHQTGPEYVSIDRIRL
jgi:2'-5' RNA ligase